MRNMTLSTESISYQATNFAVTKDSYLRFIEKEHGIMAWAAVIYIFFISINETTLSSEYLLMTKLSAMTVKMVKASFSRVSAKKKRVNLLPL